MFPRPSLQQADVVCFVEILVLIKSGKSMSGGRAYECQSYNSQLRTHARTHVTVYYRSKLCNTIYFLLSILLFLLLLLSSSLLCRVFILIFLRQTVSLGNTVLQLICCYYSWCLYRCIIIIIIIKQGFRVARKQQVSCYLKILLAVLFS